MTALSCASKKPAVAPDEYLKLNKLHHSKHVSCIEQESKVLKKAITEAQDAELDDENFFFVRNEKSALGFMKRFDLSRFTLKENQLENAAMIGACIQEIRPDYRVCNSLFPTFQYFRGMIYGLRQYPWSTSTKDMARKQILSYLKYVGESEASLMDVLLANDLFMRIANLGIVDKDLIKDSFALRHEGEAIHTLLSDKLKKISKKELQCKDAQDFYAAEREHVISLSQKLLVMVRKTENK